MSHIEKVRQEIKDIREQVQYLLGWTDERYTEFQHEQGYEYLKLYIGDQPLAHQIPYVKEYWSWWVNHWSKREKLWLEVAEAMDRGDRLAYYYELHDPSAITFRPHSVILERTYAVMIEKLIKSVQNQEVEYA